MATARQVVEAAEGLLARFTRYGPVYAEGTRLYWARHAGDAGECKVLVKSDGPRTGLEGDDPRAAAARAVVKALGGKAIFYGDGWAVPVREEKTPRGRLVECRFLDREQVVQRLREAREALREAKQSRVLRLRPEGDSIILENFRELDYRLREDLLEEAGTIPFYKETKEGLQRRQIRAVRWVKVNGQSLPAFMPGALPIILEWAREHGFRVEFTRTPWPTEKIKVDEEKARKLLQGLRDYQRRALQRWLEAGGRGTIVMPTGAGKTRVALAAIAKLRLPTLILINTVEKAQEWVRDVERYLGVKAGLFGGGKKEIAPITVATYSSAGREDNLKKLAGRFAIHIYDEGHHLPAETFKTIALSDYAPYRMVLSATPERPDQNHELIYKVVGEPVYKTTLRSLVRQGYLVPIKYTVVKVDLEEDEQEAYSNAYHEARRNPSKTTALMKIAQMARRKYPVVVEIVEKELKSDPKSKILVFTQYTEQAKTIYELLRERLGDKVAIITGKEPGRERKEALERFRRGSVNVIVTTTVLDEGVDVPDANVAIIVSGSGQPRQFIQRVGRVLRKAPGKKMAKVYEIIAKDTIEEELHSRRFHGSGLEEISIEKIIDAYAGRKRSPDLEKKLREMYGDKIYMLIMRTKVAELTKKQLQILRRLHMLRPSRVRKLDEARKARAPRYVGTWVRSPDKYDIPGIDTPEVYQRRRKIAEKTSQRMRKAARAPVEECHVKEVESGGATRYVVVCTHVVNGKKVKVLHGRYSTRRAAQAKARELMEELG